MNKNTYRFRGIRLMSLESAYTPLLNFDWPVVRREAESVLTEITLSSYTLQLDTFRQWRTSRSC
jgi:hypothetical protein